MAEWNYPHHARLTDAVDAALSEDGHCLIIDIHSFSSHPLPHEHDQDLDRPEICIGTDQFHSPFEDMTALTICEVRLSRRNEPAVQWQHRASKALGQNCRRALDDGRGTPEPLHVRGSGIPLPEFSRVATKICRLIKALVYANEATGFTASALHSARRPK
jgi:hypothetical protein